MALNLSVVRSPSGVVLDSPQQTFGDAGGSIGRGRKNDWVLNDPNRFLSSCHCAISCEDGQFYLTDLSTNGTFINCAPTPVGKEGVIPINDGDCIDIGEYRFLVTLQPDIDIPDYASNAFTTGQMPKAEYSTISASAVNNTLESDPIRPCTGHLAPTVGEMLLAKAGITNDNISQEDYENINNVVTELIPVVISGTVAALSARANIKKEFRMSTTTIQEEENNPLKFSANTAEVIERLFVHKKASDMDATEAFSDALDCISDHQLALLTGMRSAFKSMMTRFDPATLERNFDKKSTGAMLPGMKKANYWNNYANYYNDLTSNIENTFQHVFGDEFVKAYEEQLRCYELDRRKNNTPE